jgi:hypothetical protein
MDTIALKVDTKVPHIYTTKFYLLPHLDIVICGTGIAQVVMDWFVYVNSGMIVRDIDHLNEFTQKQLIKIGQQHNLDENNTTTIYHFGFSKSSKCYRGYAYRSINNFEPELFSNGSGIKPPIENMDRYLVNGSYNFIEIALQQYNDDKNSPLEKKVGIGGELIFCLLINQTIQISKIFSFLDYQENYDKMCEFIEPDSPNGKLSADELNGVI